ncbi:MAG TPA: hypothetical protein VNF92_06910 [Gemmatimonadaceae bacterium]|nr:hypothetical protein [Gemmatimonadaceae bacterium]
MPYPPDRPGDPSSEERVIERAYYENGALRWERAGIRTSQPPALPPAPPPEDPLWLEALAWVLGGFWSGIEVLAGAVGSILMVIGGLALGLLAAVAAVALVVATIAAGYGIGGWIDGPSGAAAGAWIAVAAVLITIIGAASRRDS